LALSKKNRIKKIRDFKEILELGKTVRGSFLFIKFRKNSLGVVRFGFIVPARVFKKAVTRNRIKRILSETVREDLRNIIDGYDIIVSITNKLGLEFLTDDIKEDLRRILKRVKILR